MIQHSKREASSGASTGGRTFSLRPFVFVLMVVMCSAVIYDCQTHGSFRDSKTRRLMHDYGILNAYGQATSHAGRYWNRAYKWAAKNAPQYYAHVSTYCAPYVAVGGQWLSVAKDQVLAVLVRIHIFLLIAAHLLLQWVDETFPGLFDAAMIYVGEAWAISLSVAVQLCAQLFHYLNIVVTWLAVNVFTGQLAVDKLQERMYTAVDVVQVYTVEAFKWISQQLHSK